MEELESQIAKIQLGGNKNSTSYVFVMAETADSGQGELFMVAELPLLNPAAEDSCERICLAIASTLKRAYKTRGGGDNFETAIGLINEELGRLAAMGQTQWIDKLACVLAVKQGHAVSVASCGKIAAYLLRNQEFTDISCSPSQSHPLKTFENYAVGKIRLGDMLVLSTSQLLNYLSMDRLLDILTGRDFLSASRGLIELLKQNAEPQVSFGVLLNLQVPPGQVNDSDADLEKYLVQADAAPKQTVFSGLLGYLTTAFKMDGRRTPAAASDQPKISFIDIIKSLPGKISSFWQKIKYLWQFTKSSAENVKSTVSRENLRQLSPQKKFFLISAVILLLAAAANIGIASHVKKTRAARAQVTSELKDAQSLLGNSQASLLYKDDAAAWNFWQQAKAKIPPAKDVDSTNQQLYNSVLAQAATFQTQMEKNFEPNVKNLGSLGQADNLIKLPDSLAVQANKSIISYNKTSGSVQDSALKSTVNIFDSVYLSGNNAAVYNDANLYSWDFSVGTVGPGFSQNMPAKNDFAGMSLYPVNSRIYVADKKAGAIISFAQVKNGFSKPVVAARDASLNQAVDVTIDGSIYVLTTQGVVKFQSGRLASFSLPPLATPFSGTGKIYTQKEFKNIYILDAGNKRILILDKRGSLLQTLKSKEFTDLKDFSIDEKNKLMYVLNDGSLLKVTLP